MISAFIVVIIVVQSMVEIMKPPAPSLNSGDLLITSRLPIFRPVTWVTNTFVTNHREYLYERHNSEVIGTQTPNHATVLVVLPHVGFA